MYPMDVADVAIVVVMCYVASMADEKMAYLPAVGAFMTNTIVGSFVGVIAVFALSLVRKLMNVR